LLTLISIIPPPPRLILPASCLSGCSRLVPRHRFNRPPASRRCAVQQNHPRSVCWAPSPAASVPGIKQIWSLPIPLWAVLCALKPRRDSAKCSLLDGGAGGNQPVRWAGAPAASARRICSDFDSMLPLYQRPTSDSSYRQACRPRNFPDAPFRGIWVAHEREMGALERRAARGRSGAEHCSSRRRTHP
jgi:hypothetical protein